MHLPKIFADVAHIPIGTVDAHAGVDDSRFTGEYHAPREVGAIEEVRIRPTRQPLNVCDIRLH